MTSQNPKVAAIEEMDATIARLQQQDAGHEEIERSAGYETLIRAAERQRSVDAEDAAFISECERAHAHYGSALDEAEGQGRR